jgi:penicillin-binding protein 1A
MLKGPVNEYNATGAKFGDMPVSGKTGTTSDSKDLWFAGLTPYLSCSVWIGYDKPTQLIGSSSGSAVVWGKLMAKAHENLKTKEIDEPSGLLKISVCKDSGLLPSISDSKDTIYDELFIDGTEPTTHCDIGSAKLNDGLPAAENSTDNNTADPATPPVTNDALSPPITDLPATQNNANNRGNGNNSNRNNSSPNNSTRNNTNSNSTHNSNGPGASDSNAPPVAQPTN